MIILILLAFTTYRITRLIVEDTFPPVKKLRDAFVGEDQCRLVGTKIEWLGDLLTCHWCTSVWIAAGLVLVTQIITQDVPYPLLAWPMCAAVGALIAHREDR